MFANTYVCVLIYVWKSRDGCRWVLSATFGLMRVFWAMEADKQLAAASHAHSVEAPAPHVSRNSWSCHHWNITPPTAGGKSNARRNEGWGGGIAVEQI